MTRPGAPAYCRSMPSPVGPSGPPGGAARPDIEAVKHQALGCTRCRLAQGRTQVVWADGNLDAELLLVGEAPGFHEDQKGIPFVGAAGQLLDKLLADIELDRTKAAIVNVIKCRPPGNRDPLPDEIESCRPYLEAQLGFISPTVVVTLGNFATKLLLETKEGITKLRGREFPFRDGAVLIPALHPSAVLRNGGGALAQTRADFVGVKRALSRARA